MIRVAPKKGQALFRVTPFSGPIKYINSFNLSPPVTVPFTARLVSRHHAGNPQRHEFTPTVFYRQFSSTNEPVLTVAPGDTIHTTTVDAAGTDEKGNPRALGGNPETSSMADWLTNDYKLTPSEVAQVLGSAAEYKVSEVADRNAGIILKLNKERLRPLTPEPN